jgi:hypothetical protein
MPSTRCSGCGLFVEGGDSKCHSYFQELSGRSFNDMRYGGVHRMVVDVYALQHPERYCITAKSLAAHLCGLCELLERGGSPTLPNKALRAWLDGGGPVGLVKPELPKDRGAMTIGDVRSIQDPQAYRAAVRDWADSVWAAYRPLHGTARQWFDQALGVRSRAGRGLR